MEAQEHWQLDMKTGAWVREDGTRLTQWADRSAWHATKPEAGLQVTIFPCDSVFMAMNTVDLSWPLSPKRD